jgi:hypothetical protein
MALAGMSPVPDERSRKWAQQQSQQPPTLVRPRLARDPRALADGSMPDAVALEASEFLLPLSPVAAAQYRTLLTQLDETYKRT